MPDRENKLIPDNPAPAPPAKTPVVADPGGIQVVSEDAAEQLIEAGEAREPNKAELASAPRGKTAVVTQPLGVIERLETAEADKRIKAGTARLATLRDERVAGG